MGRRLIAMLKVETNKLKTERAKSLVKKVLMECCDYCVDMPASSTGKYHPAADQGEGGLIRHIKAVCLNVETILKMSPVYDNNEDWDCVYAAAILHDCCKYTSYGQEHSHEDHPRLIANIIRRQEPVGMAERIASNAETHMSRWNKCRKSDLPDLETPKNMENMICAIADMIASQKYFNLQFDESNNIVY